MFDSLTDRLSEAFRNLRGQARLDEKNIQDGLREVRLALLEADVHFKVVKDFVDRVREKALGADVLKSLTPGQQVVKIVHDELVAGNGFRQGLRLTACVGVAQAEAEDSPELLVARAKTALSQAKEQGPGSVAGTSASL